MKYMDKQEQAVPVNFNAKAILDKINEKVEKHDKEFEYKDKEILDLVQSKGWEAFKEAISSKINYLKAMIDPESGESIIDLKDSPFTIGFKFLVISFTIYQLRQALNLPEAVLEAERLGEADEESKK